MQKKKRTDASSHDNTDEARLVEICAKKLIDAGGTPTEALLLKLLLETSPPPPDIKLMIVHPEVRLSYDRERELFLLLNSDGDVLVDCGLPDHDFIRLIRAGLVAHAESGRSDTYRFTEWMLRPPEDLEHGAIKFASIDLFAGGLVRIDSWDEDADEPRFMAKVCPDCAARLLGSE